MHREQRERALGDATPLRSKAFEGALQPHLHARERPVEVARVPVETDARDPEVGAALHRAEPEAPRVAFAPLGGGRFAGHSITLSR